MRRVTKKLNPSRKYHRWTIGDRLAVARKSVTASQDDFADMIGVGRETVRRYETEPDSYARKDPFLKSWADVTEYDLKWIRTGIEPDDGEPGGRVLSLRGRRKSPADSGATARYACSRSLSALEDLPIAS